jgi:hypothetical protein
MFKKSLLVSISLVGFVNLNPSFAAASMHPAPHAVAPTTEPCPPDSQAWIITEGSRKYMIIKHTGEEVDIKGHGGGHVDSTTMTTHHEEKKHDDKTMHPLPTQAQEALIVKLRPIQGHIYKRPLPSDSNHSEFGKPFEGKVYFMRLGIPEIGQGVDPVKDIIGTGVRDRIKALNAAKTPENYKPKNRLPTPKDVAGLTVRNMQLQTNPKTRQVESNLGAVNRAQTGLTGEKTLPKIDASASNPAKVAPPSNINAEIPPAPPPPAG